MAHVAFSGPQSLKGRPLSLWAAGPPVPHYPALSGSLKVDVAVIGAGIAGLTTAWLLKRAGAKVAVIEAERVASGVSGHTTAKVTVAHGLIYNDLIRTAGKEKARQYASANQAGMDFISDYIEDNEVQCDYQRTFACTYTDEERHLPAIEAEVKAAAELGLPAAYAGSLPLPFGVKGAVRFEQQAFFHPRKYMLDMARRIHGGGCTVFEKSRVLEVHEADPCKVITRQAKVQADQVVVATHFPILNRGMLFAKMSPFRAYLIAARTSQTPLEGMYINVGEPRRTIRRHVGADGDALLLVGGENHAVGHAENTVHRYLNVQAFAQTNFGIESILYRWSTQDNSPVDRVPFIGRHSALSRRIYVVTGMRGWGLTNGTAAGLILTDMICGRANAWAPVFDPGRAVPYLTASFLAHNVHVARTFIKDMVTQSGDTPAAGLAPGAGAITGMGGKTVAAFKDGQGTLHAVSPYCRHMGCKVAWNSAEQSWDCPCHGSRYDIDGRVLHAPARTDLKTKGEQR